MKTRYTIAALAATSLVAHAAVVVTKDAASFPQNYLGSDIWNGTAYANGWDGAGASGGTTADYSLNGSNLVISQTTNNGWLQHDNGATPWEGLTSSDSWTVEVRVHVQSAPGGVSIWGAVPGLGAGIVTINDNGVTVGAGAAADLDSTDNTDGFHTFRMAYDQPNGVFNVWRDGALLTDTQGITLNTGLSRLIIGDCCSSYGGNGNVFEVEYVAYDTTGAFAPVPEPSSSILFGLGIFAFASRRRR